MKILAFAYACEPGKGSEPGAGWIWARMLARLGEVWVITRANNRATIERALPSVPERDQMRFVYVDLPHWARFWKRGQRGVRLYYLLWQIAALRRARQLCLQTEFDFSWHLTLANIWFGSLAALAGPPFIYGPVGGGVGMPWRLVSCLGARGTAYEVLRAFGRFVGRRLNPLSRLAWRRARLILVQNPETYDWLPRRHRAKSHVFPHVVLDTPPQNRSRRHKRSPTAIFPARLLAWKGGALALHAAALVPGLRLLICGTGPDEPRLRRMVRQQGIEDRILFLGWQERSEVLRLMQDESDILLFPSLHDEAGWVVAEAIAAGLPVVCLNHGGPRVVAGAAALTAETSGKRTAVETLLARRLEESLTTNGHATEERARELSLPSQSRRLDEILQNTLHS